MIASLRLRNPTSHTHRTEFLHTPGNFQSGFILLQNDIVLRVGRGVVPGG